MQLPLAIEGKVFYRARVQFTDGSVLTLADNLADPYYQLYQGHTVPLYCTDFETDPLTITVEAPPGSSLEYTRVVTEPQYQPHSPDR